MKCFTHQANEAVGVCKACNKGICAECTEDLGHSLACKSTCVEQAHLVDSIIQKNAVTMKATERNRNIAPVFYAVVGSLFIYYGIDRYPRSELSLMMGVGFLIFAAANFFVLQKWVKELGSKPEGSSSS